MTTIFSLAGCLAHLPLFKLSKYNSPATVFNHARRVSNMGPCTSRNIPRKGDGIRRNLCITPSENVEHLTTSPAGGREDATVLDTLLKSSPDSAQRGLQQASAMATRGPTRHSLQGQCAVPPIENSKLLQFYFNCARQLLMQGEIYYNERDIAPAYVFLKRFLTLAIDGIPNHNAFRNQRYQKDKAWLQRERQRAMLLLQAISKELDEADERNARAAAAGSQAYYASLSASTNWWDNIPEAPNHDVSTSKPPSSSMIPEASVGGAVPSASPSNDVYGGGGAGTKAGGDGRGHAYGHTGIVRRETMPLQDAFRNLSLDQDSPAAGHYPTLGTPEYQRERPSMRPKPSALGVMRRVVLPSSLVAQFEKIAQPNTDRPPYGIETCGILAGRLSQNVLEMTTLIIPKQEGTSDSCATTDETELFNHMLANKLITLGWIHTHPKQDCFMSSVDVHTHCGYQLMLPEAVAVVYAPSDNKKRLGVFRLTQPEGMKLIQECKLTGFHVHPDDITIYKEANIVWSPAAMKVVDLR